MQDEMIIVEKCYAYKASGLSGSVTGITVVEMCSGKASIWSIVHSREESTDTKRRDSRLLLYVQTGCQSGSSVANHE
ncbi:hypothetical protein TNCV_1719981 [Trichonephila clavipes]|nr:hypothetical protein TNCV_1719981 [Trichonephila clavipes]